MGDVVQLPVQHRAIPRCPNCGDLLPPFAVIELRFSPLENALLAKFKMKHVTIHGICGGCMLDVTITRELSAFTIPVDPPLVFPAD